MTALAALTPTELRLLVRDWTVLVFAFVFPPLVMLILAGVFGTHATVGFGWRNPQHYYVAASVGVPVLALALVGLPVTLAAYRERGVLRRFEAFGVSPADGHRHAGDRRCWADPCWCRGGARRRRAYLRHPARHPPRPGRPGPGCEHIDPLAPRHRGGTRRAQRTRCPGNRPDRVLPPVSAGWRRATEGSDDRRDALNQQRTALPDPRDRRSLAWTPGSRGSACGVRGVGRAGAGRDLVAHAAPGGLIAHGGISSPS